MNLYERFNHTVEKKPNSDAIEGGGGKSVSYRELDRMARSISAWTHEEGIRADEYIGVYLPDCPTYLAAYLGIWRSGCVAVPINARFGIEQVQYVLNDIEPAAILTGDGLKENIDAVVKKTNFIDKANVQYGRIEGSFSSDMLPDPESAPTVSKRLDSEHAIIMHTSGTTGDPKPVVQTHRNLSAQAEAATSVFRLTPETAVVNAIPLYSVGGFHGVTLPVVLNGGSIVIMGKWDPEDWAQYVEAVEPTHSLLAMTMMVDILNTDATRECELGSLEACYYGGSSTPEPVIEEFEDEFDVKLLDFYGQTETCGASVSYDISSARRTGAMGKPIPCVEAKVVDLDTDEEVPPEEEGELLLRGDNISPGYLNRPKLNKSTFIDGWVRTDDLVKQDEEGYLYYLDRVDDIILSGGWKVAPATVENVLQKMDEIKNVAVFGTDHERLGETVTAAVIRDAESLTQADVKSYSDDNDDIAGYEKPRRIFFVEEFPKTGPRKINKVALRKQAENRFDV